MVKSKSSFRKPLGTHLGTAFAIDTGRDNAASIASPLTTREETLNAYMHQRVAVSENAHRTGSTRLHANHCSLVGQEAMTHASESLEAFLQAMADALGQPEMEG